MLKQSPLIFSLKRQRLGKADEVAEAGIFLVYCGNSSHGLRGVVTAGQGVQEGTCKSSWRSGLVLRHRGGETIGVPQYSQRVGFPQSAHGTISQCTPDPCTSWICAPQLPLKAHTIPENWNCCLPHEGACTNQRLQSGPFEFCRCSCPMAVMQGSP